MLTPFATSLNNHLPAAAATALTIYLYLAIAERLDDSVSGEVKSVPWDWWLWAGMAAAFTAANELPALSMMCLWFVLFYLLQPRGALYFACGVLILAIAFFGTNWLAHGSLRPPYMHRDNGSEIAQFPKQQMGATPDKSLVLDALRQQNLIAPDAMLSIKPSGERNRWVAGTQDNRLFALNKSDDETATWTLSHWDDWYDYGDSYWTDGKQQGVDTGESSRVTYFLNMTIGHHGLFSLTPLWLLVPVGVFFGFAFGPIDYRRFVYAATIASVVCIVFYLMRPEIDRNYGGKSCCFRWLVWFAPMWLVMMGPVVDSWSDNRRYRIGLLALLGLSVFSMALAIDGPWQHPWLYRYWEFLGWIS